MYSDCRTDEGAPTCGIFSRGPLTIAAAALAARRRLARTTWFVALALASGLPWTAACQHMAVAAAQPLLQQLRAEHQVAARGRENLPLLPRLCYKLYSCIDVDKIRYEGPSIAEWCSVASRVAHET